MFTPPRRKSDRRSSEKRFNGLYNRYKTRRCFYCDKLFIHGHAWLQPTRDHIVPAKYRSWFDPATADEIRLACYRCNVHRAANFDTAEMRYGEAYVMAYLLKGVALALNSDNRTTRVYLLWPTMEYKFGATRWNLWEVVNGWKR